MAQKQEAADVMRPEISVFWKPGCSSCLRVKEYMEELGQAYESVNVEDKNNPKLGEYMTELMAAGFRSIPVVRKGNRFTYAQSLDDVANLLGVTRNHKRLSDDVLFDKMDQVLKAAVAICRSFPEEELQKQVIPTRDRKVEKLIKHVALIVNAYIMRVEESVIDTNPYEDSVEATVMTPAVLLAFIEQTRVRLRDWIASDKRTKLPALMPTYYGDKSPSDVLERAAWHAAQHVRQLDIVAAGRVGAELKAPPGLFDGLPMPKRLWQ